MKSFTLFLIIVCCLSSALAKDVHLQGDTCYPGTDHIVKIYLGLSVIARGTLLNARTVLTTAVSVKGLLAANLKVRVGLQLLPVRTIKCHPGYDPNSQVNNIAVLILDVAAIGVADFPKLPSNSLIPVGPLCGYVDNDSAVTVRISLRLLVDILLCTCKTNTICLKANVSLIIGLLGLGNNNIGTPVLCGNYIIGIVAEVKLGLSLDLSPNYCAYKIYDCLDFIQSCIE